MHVVSVNVGRPRIVVHRDQPYSTAINKSPVEGPVELTELGLVGDKPADTRYHGGPQQALCVYPHEHYPYFADRLGAPGTPGTPGSELPVPSFGENLTTSGLIEAELCVGDVLRIGDRSSGATVAITKPREPCSKLARKHDSPELVRWVHETGFTGFYLRVIHAAPLAAGAPIELVNRPHEGLTVAGAMHALFSPTASPDFIARYAECPALAAGWRERMSERLTKLTS